MSFRFPLATTSWGKEEIDAMQRVIASGMFTMGENVQALEHDFARYVGSRHCVMVNSGSSANLLMVAALFYTKNAKLKLQRGDEVIVPAVSWSTTYYPLYQYGLKIKFVDIDLHTLELRSRPVGASRHRQDPRDHGGESAGQSERFWTYPADHRQARHRLMEDNCESMGATYQGKQAGTLRCDG